MRAPTYRFRRLALVAVPAIAATVVAGGVALAPAQAPAVHVDLCAKAGTLALPGASVPVWGFARLGPGETCADVQAHVPGPVLDVAEGVSVTVTVHNDLARAVGFELPGRPIEQGAVTAPPGGSADFTFTAAAPGTFAYQSPADAGRQIAMGLYGALIVRPATAGRAYGDAASAYDVERTLVLSAIDPALNADPIGFPMHRFAPTYWLIDGAAFPGTTPIDAAAGQRVLLRYVNAGFDNTTMALLGTHQRVIARDGYRLGNPFDAVAETVAAGQTTDAIVTLPAAGRYPLYNRQLHLTNGAGHLGDAGFSPGGMMTFLNGS